MFSYSVSEKGDKHVIQIATAVNDKIVISIINPLNENYNGLVTSPDRSAAEELAKLLPNAKIVKALNTIFAGVFDIRILKGEKIDFFVAGNDSNAVETVMQLVADAGFNPLNAGKLSVSRSLESMMVLLIALSMKYGYNWIAGWKILTNITIFSFTGAVIQFFARAV